MFFLFFGRRIFFFFDKLTLGVCLSFHLWTLPPPISPPPALEPTNLLFVSVRLFCFVFVLDPTCKRDHAVFVFL